MTDEKLAAHVSRHLLAMRKGDTVIVSDHQNAMRHEVRLVRGLDKWLLEKRTGAGDWERFGVAIADSEIPR